MSERIKFIRQADQEGTEGIKIFKLSQRKMTG